MQRRDAPRVEPPGVSAGTGARVSAYDAVLLIAYGGPERAEDVRPYLRGILRGRPVPPGRVEQVAHHYELFGGRSPLTELTRRQAAALEAALHAGGRRMRVYVGMRNWHPYLSDTLAAMRDAGVRRVLGIVMAPHRSHASWEQYHQNVADAKMRVGPRAPDVEYVGPWFDHPAFIDAQADRVRHVLNGLPAGQRSAAFLLFTAHSIPAAMAARSRYEQEFQTTARLVAAGVARVQWQVAYQSRSGDPREPWLEPDVNSALRDLAGRGVPTVVIVPAGFVSDHIEVLYDLDTEARNTAGEAGIAYHRTGTVMDHPAFIEMLAALVTAASPQPA